MDHSPVVDLDTFAGKPRVECLILDCGYTTFPQQSLTPIRDRLDWTSTSQRKLCLIQCSDGKKVSLSTTGKSRHFLHAVRSGNSDTCSASARHPWAQSYFTTQMSTRRDRWNNPTKPDCAIQRANKMSGNWDTLFPPQVLSTRVCHV